MEDLRNEITTNAEIYKTQVDEYEELMKSGNK